MKLYWIETSSSAALAIASRPRGGDWLEDDLKVLRDGGVDLLVSMLTPGEQQELALEREAALCEQLGIQYLNFAVEDRSIPASISAVRQLLEQLESAAAKGLRIAIHCRAGSGRSSMLLAALMTQQGCAASAAFAAIASARGTAVPDTPEQAQWVAGFAEAKSQGAHAFFS